MRSPLFFVTSIALLMATSPALAAPCPTTKADATKFLAGLSKLGNDTCFYPCQQSFKFHAGGLNIFGTQPTVVKNKLDRSGLLSVVFVMPGAIGKYITSFKKAYPGPYCTSDGIFCSSNPKLSGEDMLKQVQLIQDRADGNTYLHCNFTFTD